MRIIGIGTDIVEIARVERLVNKFGEKLYQRILNRTELALRAPSVKNLAKRFCAKESIAKALGVGIGEKLSFQDITILNDKISGKPEVSVRGYGHFQFLLSISDEKHYAVAFAVVQG